MFAGNPSCFKSPLQTTPLRFLIEQECWCQHFCADLQSKGKHVQTSLAVKNYTEFWLKLHEVAPTELEKIYFFPGSFGIPLQCFFKPVLMFLRSRST